MKYCILFVYLVLYLFAVYQYGDAVNVTVDESKCKELFTHGYGYRQFMHFPSSSGRGGGLNLRFWVKARSNAHILLSPSPSPEETEPVYEVVLGAGKNTFSDIRRMRRTSTKFSAYTKDILSGTELKGFWVKINNEGFLMVGNDGDDLPLLEWQDPDPLHIEYFSFSTWSGVAGKWLYDCATDSREKEESAVVQPVLTPKERLRKALLTKYNVYTPPVSDLSQPLDIKVGVQVNRVQLVSAFFTVCNLISSVWC